MVGLRQVYGFVIVEHGRRTIVHTAATFSPTRKWIIQQLCEAFRGECRYKYLICDNDKKFGKYLRLDKPLSEAHGNTEFAREPSEPSDKNY
jgi:hypothetical protein